MGKVIMSGIVPQLAEPVSYKANFADNDWATIIDAVQKNKVPETWVVGDQKAMSINGTSYLIDIIGKNHDNYSDGSGKAPLTFQLYNPYTNAVMNDAASNGASSNSGGWTSSKMRTTTIPAIFATMPSEVQSGIKGVNKLASAGDTSSTITTTSDKLFLLSEIEVFGKTTWSATGEGSQYDYYKAGNSKVKNKSGWWLRSPAISNNNSFCFVNSDGTPASGMSKYSYGVAFAFCF